MCGPWAISSNRMFLIKYNFTIIFNFINEIYEFLK